MTQRSHHAHHSHSSHGDQRRLLWSWLLVTSFMLAEAIGGWWSGSLALLADAGHMLSDSVALALSLFAAWIATKEASPQRTFGYLRVEILAALFNGLLLIVVALSIAWEAWERLQEPSEINTGVMSGVAVLGLLINLLMLRILHDSDHSNLNIRGAWLHVLGDTLGSVGVLVAAGLTTIGLTWADPCISVLIGLLILFSSIRLLSAAIAVLMEQSPASVDVAAVRGCLESSDGVEGVHCLHVWSISSNMLSVSAHVVLKEGRQVTEVLPKLQQRLKESFNAQHITLQLEPADCAPCDEAFREDCLASLRQPATCSHSH